jgi:hypothetical protein
VDSISVVQKNAFDVDIFDKLFSDIGPTATQPKTVSWNNGPFAEGRICPSYKIHKNVLRLIICQFFVAY